MYFMLNTKTTIATSRVTVTYNSAFRPNLGLYPRLMYLLHFLCLLHGHALSHAFKQTYTIVNSISFQVIIRSRVQIISINRAPFLSCWKSKWSNSGKHITCRCMCSISMMQTKRRKAVVTLRRSCALPMRDERICAALTYYILRSEQTNKSIMFSL